MTVMRRAPLVALGLLDFIVPVFVSAHSSSEGGDTAMPWIRHGAEAAALVAIALLYVTGYRRLRWRRAGGVTTIRAGLFIGGLVVLGGTLAPPVERLASVSFAAHMTQHLLLIMVVAPMLALGRPLPTLAGAGEPGRRIAGAAGRIVTPLIARPIAVWLLNAGIVVIWHIPTLFEAALESALVHALEHATLLGSATLFWAVLVESARARVPAFGVLYLFAAALQCGAIGALVTLSDTAWYPVQTATTARWSPLEDQQLAGALMWVPGGSVYLVAALAVLARSLSVTRRRPR
jgi:putative membrane protein